MVATQEMERVAGSPEIDGVERGVVSARMWAAYKSLVLLCPQEVRDVAAEYANALGDVMWNGAAGEQQVWEPLWAPSNAFGEAIRKWTGADVDWPSDDR